MDSATFILFGATGDLTKRKIYPALYNLYLDQKLPKSFSLVGLGRRTLTDETFRAHVEKSLYDFSRRGADNAAKVTEFLQLFRYHVLNIDHKEDYVKLRNLVESREQAMGLPQNRLFYLSVGPEYFEPAAENIQESGLGTVNGWKRLVIEKPFGHDLQSARELNAKLGFSFSEEEIFRIDHYLGKPMLQGLKALRQSNPVIQALMKNQYIANVQITANETVGVEERAGYYDHVGALRDMVQNHMLQLMMMTATQLPGKSTPDTVSLKKKQVMEALEPLRKQDIGFNIVRGQYTEGNINGQPALAYVDEPGVAKHSRIETFVAAKLQVNDFFWRGVPFYLRTGKRLNEKSTRIVVEFKEPLAASPSEQEQAAAKNLLIIEMSPNESISLQLNMLDLQHNGLIRPVRIDLQPGKQDLPEAYENLIFDAINGDPTFFAHWDEVELSWKWVQPILEAFEENLVPLHPYEAGSYGPEASDALLERDGNHWWFDDKPEEKTIISQKGLVYSVNQ